MVRIVRKQSLLSKIKAYPLDLLLELNEQRESIDWDSYSNSIAVPLGFILTVTYFFLRLWDDYNIIEEKQPYFKYDYNLLKDSKYFNDDKNSKLRKFFDLLKLIIISINFLNTNLFLFKTRKYTIFNKDKLTSNSVNAIKITKNVNSSIFGKILKIFNRNSYDNNEDDIESYWELKIWNPSIFSTHLFVSFPPFNILFLYLSQSSFLNLIFLFLTSIILYFVIIKGYLVLINDKQILYQETFDEYQRKFVKPKLSVPTFEVSIDATKGPNSFNNTEIYSPHLTEKIFKYHDFKGNESVEKFNHGEFTPVKKRSSLIANNNLQKQIFTPKRYSQQSPLVRKFTDRNI